MHIRWSTTPNNTTCICLDCQKQGKQPCISHTAEGPVAVLIGKPAITMTSTHHNRENDNARIARNTHQ